MSEANSAAETQQNPVFNIERTYVKNSSLEVPHAPEVFLAQEAPTLEVNISIGGQNIENHFYETTVTATVTATLPDKRVLFLAEAEQGGIFRIENISESDMPLVLNVTCPNILFPYVREVISDMTTRAGFPPVYIAPLNFESMYRRQLEQQNSADGAAQDA